MSTRLREQRDYLLSVDGIGMMKLEGDGAVMYAKVFKLLPPERRQSYWNVLLAETIFKILSRKFPSYTIKLIVLKEASGLDEVKMGHPVFVDEGKYYRAYTVPQAQELPQGTRIYALSR